MIFVYQTNWQFFLKNTMTNNNNCSLTKNFSDALKIFSSEGRKIDGVYDLLIRGSGAKEKGDLVENYSDLDTSIVVQEVSIKVLKQIKFLYETIKESFPHKLSITVVSKKDYLNDYHHHGIKPIYYTYSLGSAVSLLHGTIVRDSRVSLATLQFDCFSNIAYLIHDIRSKYLALDLDDQEEVREFFCHLIKRSKHLIRNCIFIRTGHIDENIDQDLFKICFPEIDPAFLQHLKNYKINFEQITNAEKVEDSINILLAVLEKVHGSLLSNYPPIHHKEIHE